MYTQKFLFYTLFFTIALHVGAQIVSDVASGIFPADICVVFFFYLSHHLEYLLILSQKDVLGSSCIISSPALESVISLSSSHSSELRMKFGSQNVGIKYAHCF